VLLLAGRFPDRLIVATDPAAGMISFLWAALRQRGVKNVLASTGTAEELAGSVHQGAGVFSAFSLQLVADQLAALAAWSACLREGGTVAAIFWPRPDPAAPAGRIRAAVESVTGEQRPDWEQRAVARLGEIGLRLARDEVVRHEMEHAGPEAYFDAVADAGPLQPLKLRAGAEVLARIRAAWLKDHGLAQRGGRWVDAPPARLWVIERVAGYEPEH
jgi:ubiquinone/menaquinone biosynthesis C-methylase UbiE